MIKTRIFYRWLTTGVRILVYYMSHHDLNEDGAEVLRLLTTFVAQVYLPMFFSIKGKHLISNGSSHQVTLIRLWRQQDVRVQEATKPYLLMEAWWAHPEPLLLNLLASDEKSDREFAIQKVLAIRKDSEKGTLCTRDYTVPKSVNLNANGLKDLIAWDQDPITEPVFTALLSNDELRALSETPLCAPGYSCHTQSCERAVQGVAEASKRICGWERRHRLVLTRMGHRQRMP